MGKAAVVSGVLGGRWYSSVFVWCSTVVGRGEHSNDCRNFPSAYCVNLLEYQIVFCNVAT